MRARGSTHACSLPTFSDGAGNYDTCTDFDLISRLDPLWFCTALYSPLTSANLRDAMESAHVGSKPSSAASTVPGRIKMPAFIRKSVIAPPKATRSKKEAAAFAEAELKAKEEVVTEAQAKARELSKQPSTLAKGLDTLDAATSAEEADLGAPAAVAASTMSAGEPPQHAVARQDAGFAASNEARDAPNKEAVTGNEEPEVISSQTDEALVAASPVTAPAGVRVRQQRDSLVNARVARARRGNRAQGHAVRHKNSIFAGWLSPSTPTPEATVNGNDGDEEATSDDDGDETWSRWASVALGNAIAPFVGAPAKVNWASARARARAANAFTRELSIIAEGETDATEAAPAQETAMIATDEIASQDANGHLPEAGSTVALAATPNANQPRPTHIPAQAGKPRRPLWLLLLLLTSMALMLLRNRRSAADVTTGATSSTTPRDLMPRRFHDRPTQMNRGSHDWHGLLVPLRSLPASPFAKGAVALAVPFAIQLALGPALGALAPTAMNRFLPLSSTGLATLYRRIASATRDLISRVGRPVGATFEVSAAASKVATGSKAASVAKHIVTDSISLRVPPLRGRSRMVAEAVAVAIAVKLVKLRAPVAAAAAQQVPALILKWTSLGGTPHSVQLNFAGLRWIGRALRKV